MADAEKTLQLVILTQEQQLLEREVRSVTVTTTDGEITVLPNHIPLFSKLALGNLVFRWQENGKLQEDEFAVSGGFLDVSPVGVVTVLADAAVRAEDIEIAKVEEAKRRAEEAMENRGSEVEFRIAEASLRRALNELRVANKRQKSSGRPQI